MIPKITGAIGLLFLIGIIGVTIILHKEPAILPTLKPNPADIHTIVDANNQFALDYYSQLVKKEENNIFFSPFSISSALAMTYEGAVGETAKEMRSVLYFPENTTTRRTEFLAVARQLNKKDVPYELYTANALWAEKNYTFSKDYLHTIETYYDGDVKKLDFQNNPEQSRQVVNSWVEEQTNDKIKNLIPQNGVGKETRLILTNAIYFKGEWDRQFEPKNSKEENFTVQKNNVVKTKMMKQIGSESVFPYMENKDIQMLEMPYSGNELSMVLILPKNTTLALLEKNLTTKQIKIWKEGLKKQRVDVYVPKFTYGTKYEMSEDLQAMGMRVSFSNHADFSYMTSDLNLRIDQVIHKAFIEVNEEGSEAAAATAVSMIVVSVRLTEKEEKIPIFRADHPFLFFIQQKDTGAILFLGRVINPNA